MTYHGVWGLSRFWGLGGEKSPEKKVSKCVWGYFGGVFMMFPDGFDAFWALQTPFRVLWGSIAAQGARRARARHTLDLSPVPCSS